MLAVPFQGKGGKIPVAGIQRYLLMVYTLGRYGFDQLQRDSALQPVFFSQTAHHGGVQPAATDKLACLQRIIARVQIGVP